MIVPFLASQDMTSLTISAGISADFFVTNSKGQKSGKDPRPGGGRFKQIKGAGYGMENLDIDGDAAFALNKFHVDAIVPPEDFNCTITILGAKLDTVNLCVDIVHQGSAKTVSYESERFVDTNSVFSYRLTYFYVDSTRSYVATFVPEYHNNTVWTDVKCAVRLGLLKDRKTAELMLERSAELKEDLDAGAETRAVGLARSMVAKIKEMKQATSSGRSIADFAYKVIESDLQYIIHSGGTTNE